MDINYTQYKSNINFKSILIIEMKRIILPNGLTILYQYKDSKSIAIEIMVKVGSNYENDNERGIAHLIEHLLFEGTKKRSNGKEIANEIEKIGGDFNAFTSNYKTNYYVKVLNKHFGRAADVLSDILFDPLFRKKDFVREREVVLKEIDMIYDDPRFYQWVLFHNNLFKKHRCKYPSYGDKKILMNSSLDDVKKFYNSYYHPNNMVISIVGGVKNWEKIITKKFGDKQNKKTPHLKKIKEPLQIKNKTNKQKRNIRNTFLILGYKTVQRKHKDSYVLDIIQAVLGRGQSGKIFHELRGKKGLAYEVGTETVSGLDYGYFAIFASIKKKNILTAKKTILQELLNLNELTDQDLKDAKTYIEGSYYMDLEDNQKMANQLLFWEQQGDVHLINSYIRNIKKIQLRDIRRVIKKYFNHYTLCVIEGK